MLSFLKYEYVKTVNKTKVIDGYRYIFPVDIYRKRTKKELTNIILKCLLLAPVIYITLVLVIGLAPLNR